MSNFAARLDELLDAKSGKWYVIEGRGVQMSKDGGFVLHPQISEVEHKAELIAYLVNHAPAIRDLVLAAEMAQESLDKHEEACKGWIDDHHLNAKLAIHKALAKLEGA